MQVETNSLKPMSLPPILRVTNSGLSPQFGLVLVDGASRNCFYKIVGNLSPEQATKLNLDG